MGKQKILFILGVLVTVINIGASFIPIESRIVEGSPAAPGQFPWHVILKKDEIDDLLCGASIISSEWVLTAAHCTYAQTSLYLMFGSLLLENENAVSMTATEFYIHPNYNQENLNNDVSLIELPQPLTFTRTIQPVALVPSLMANYDFTGTVATIAGFGLTDDEYLEDSDVLLWATVQLINNDQCVSVFGADVVISSTMCAKGYGNPIMSICSGDSGGALVTRDANGNNIQIGINSFVAQDQCTEGIPSGYVRVSSYLNFITSTTGITFD